MWKKSLQKCFRTLWRIIKKRGLNWPMMMWRDSCQLMKESSSITLTPKSLRPRKNNWPRRRKKPKRRKRKRNRKPKRKRKRRKNPRKQKNLRRKKLETNPKDFNHPNDGNQLLFIISNFYKCMGKIKSQTQFSHSDGAFLRTSPTNETSGMYEVDVFDTW